MVFLLLEPEDIKCCITSPIKRKELQNVSLFFDRKTSTCAIMFISIRK